jgi:hypothetical protein
MARRKGDVEVVNVADVRLALHEARDRTEEALLALLAGDRRRMRVGTPELLMLALRREGLLSLDGRLVQVFDTGIAVPCNS